MIKFNASTEKLKPREVIFLKATQKSKEQLDLVPKSLACQSRLFAPQVFIADEILFLRILGDVSQLKKNEMETYSLTVKNIKPKL